MKKLLISLLIIFNFLAVSVVAVPQTASAAVAAGCDKSTSFLGLPAWYKYLDIGQKDDDPCAVIGPVQSGTDKFDWKKGAGLIGLAVVDILLRIGVMVAVGYIIYGGFRFILSQGDPESVKHARNTILNSVIGLVIAIFATLIVNFVGGTFIR